MKWIRSRRTGKRHWMEPGTAAWWGYFALCCYAEIPKYLDLPGDDNDDDPRNCRSCLRIKKAREKR